MSSETPSNSYTNNNAGKSDGYGGAFMSCKWQKVRQRSVIARQGKDPFCLAPQSLSAKIAQAATFDMFLAFDRGRISVEARSFFEMTAPVLGCTRAERYVTNNKPHSTGETWMTLVLSNEDVQKSLAVKECLEVMEESYREQAASRAVNRPTCHSYLAHSLPDSTYSFKSVDGGVEKYGVLALRVTSDIVQEQRIHGSVRLEKLPLAGKGMFVGLVQLFSIETGELLAIMPDGLIQQTRVGVTSALAMKAMARRDSQVLGLIGSGGQAKAHYRFMTSIMPLKKVKVFSPNKAHRKAFVAEMTLETGVSGEPVDSAEAAVRGSDVICSATNSSQPVVDVDWLEAGMHYNSIREFETDLRILGKSDVIGIHTRFGGIQHYQPPGITDDMPGVRREKPRDWSKYPEICDFIAGKTPGRTDQRQITFFLNNVGTGVQFAAMGYCAYKGAKEQGLGREIPSEWFMQEIKP